MKLGTENRKKVGFLAALALVAVYLLYSNVFSQPDRGGPPPAQEPARASAPALPDAGQSTPRAEAPRAPDSNRGASRGATKSFTRCSTRSGRKTVSTR
jgi:hypothetical protein